MKTTIVVEDGAVVTSPPEHDSPQSDSGADVAKTASISAGGAPIDDTGAAEGGAAAGDATSEGPPPTWLLAAIAEAGGLAQPTSSPSDGTDAGAAPA